jgi:hypothetical protein
MKFGKNLHSSHIRRAMMHDHDRSLTIGLNTFQPVAETVHALGVLLDPELTPKQHISKVAGACFHQLRHPCRRIGQVVAVRMTAGMEMV